MQKLNDPERVSSTWVKHLYGLVYQLNETKAQMTRMSLKDARSHEDADRKPSIGK